MVFVAERNMAPQLFLLAGTLVYNAADHRPPTTDETTNDERCVSADS
jgi:hypothetical protein